MWAVEGIYSKRKICSHCRASNLDGFPTFHCARDQNEFEEDKFDLGNVKFEVFMVYENKCFIFSWIKGERIWDLSLWQ